MPFPISLTSLKSSLLCCKKRGFLRRREKRGLDISAPTDPRHLALPETMRLRSGGEASTIPTTTPSSTHLLSLSLSSHPPSPALSPFPSLSASSSSTSSSSCLPHLTQSKNAVHHIQEPSIEEIQLNKSDGWEEEEERLPNAASTLPTSLPTPPRCRDRNTPVVRVRGMLPGLATAPAYGIASIGGVIQDPFEVYTSGSSVGSVRSGSEGGSETGGEGREEVDGGGVDRDGDMRMLDVDLEVEILDGKEWGCEVEGVKSEGGSEGMSESESDNGSEKGVGVERRVLVAV